MVFQCLWLVVSFYLQCSSKNHLWRSKPKPCSASWGGLNRFSTAVAVGPLMWRKVFFWMFLANDRNDETKDAGAQHHGCAVSSCEELRMLLGRLGFEIYWVMRWAGSQTCLREAFAKNIARFACLLVFFWLKIVHVLRVFFVCFLT